MNHDPKAATQRKKATFAGDLHLLRKLRGKDLNLRPLGYEPNELPLLHPAILNYKPEPSIVNGRKTVLGICGGTVVRKREKFRCPKVGAHWERDRGRDCARSLGSGSEKAGHAGDDYIEEGSSHGEWPADDTGNDAEVQRNRS